MRQENAAWDHAWDDWTAHLLLASAFGGPHGKIDALLEVSMGVSKNKLYRQHVLRRTMVDCKPPQISDYSGCRLAIECDSPPPNNFSPPSLSTAL